MSAGTVSPRYHRKRRDTVRERSQPSVNQRRVVRTFPSRTVSQSIDRLPELSNDEEIAFIARSTMAIAILGMLPLVVFLIIYYFSPH